MVGDKWNYTYFSVFLTYGGFPHMSRMTIALRQKGSCCIRNLPQAGNLPREIP